MLGKVEQAQLLLVATSGNEIRVVGGIGDGADDMIVLNGQ